MRGRYCQRPSESVVDNWLFFDQKVGGQRDPDGNRTQDRHQYRGGGAILHRPDTRMDFGVQMVSQVLDRGVEELSRQYTRAGEQHQSPPHRLRSQHQHHHNHDDENADLELDAVLGTQSMRKSRQGEPQAPAK